MSPRHPPNSAKLGEQKDAAKLRAEGCALSYPRCPLRCAALPRLCAEPTGRASPAGIAGHGPGGEGAEPCPGDTGPGKGLCSAYAEPN